MYIDEKKARAMLVDITKKIMNDVSDDAAEHNQQAFGMMIMCVNLGIITEKECSILMEYSTKRYLTVDFEEDFIDGLYRYASETPGTGQDSTEVK